MRRLLTGLLLALLVHVSGNADWTKPYFAATKPGSWATSRLTSTITEPSTTTLTRLPDQDGRIVIDQYSEFKNKDTPPSTMRYVLAAGFEADRKLIDFLTALDAASASVGKDGTFTDLPADTVKAISAMPPYGPGAVFKNVETVDGKPCDHYTYSRTDNGRLESGEIWLSASVPFGVVKQTIKSTDASGKPYTAEVRLVDSGFKK
jgi:hypothetical protein